MRTSVKKGSHWQPLGRYIYFFGAVPYSRTFFIVGSFARENQTKKSDVDLVVLAKEKRVWACRLFFLITLSLLGKRRTKIKRESRFCLNGFFGKRKECEEVLENFYGPHKKIEGGPNVSLVFRKFFELILEILFVGPLIDWVFRVAFSKYILKRLGHIKKEEGLVSLEQNKIFYHPKK